MNSCGSFGTDYCLDNTEVMQLISCMCACTKLLEVATTEALPSTHVTCPLSSGHYIPFTLGSYGVAMTSFLLNSAFSLLQGSKEIVL